MAQDERLWADFWAAGGGVLGAARGRQTEKPQKYEMLGN